MDIGIHDQVQSDEPPRKGTRAWTSVPLSLPTQSQHGTSCHGPVLLFQVEFSQCLDVQFCLASLARCRPTGNRSNGTEISMNIHSQWRLIAGSTRREPIQFHKRA